jgi:hypothetical protein
MSLAYPDRQSGGVLWLGLAASLGLHGLLAIYSLQSSALAPLPETLGLKGRELIDLAEVEMLMAAPETDLATGAPADESQAALDSPEKTEIAKTSNDPLLAQIPYQVPDPDLQFRLANPDQNPEAHAKFPEIKEDPKDKAPQTALQRPRCLGRSMPQAKAMTPKRVCQMKKQRRSPRGKSPSFSPLPRQRPIPKRRGRPE